MLFHNLLIRISGKNINFNMLRFLVIVRKMYLFAVYKCIRKLIELNPLVCTRVHLKVGVSITYFFSVQHVSNLNLMLMSCKVFLHGSQVNLLFVFINYFRSDTFKTKGKPDSTPTITAADVTQRKTAAEPPAEPKAVKIPSVESTPDDLESLQKRIEARVGFVVECLRI